MNDYPFLVSETCTICGHNCIAIVELLAAGPDTRGELIRIRWEEEMTVLDACVHAIAET